MSLNNVGIATWLLDEAVDKIIKSGELSLVKDQLMFFNQVLEWIKYPLLLENDDVAPYSLTYSYSTSSVDQQHPHPPAQTAASI